MPWIHNHAVRMLADDLQHKSLVEIAEEMIETKAEHEAAVENLESQITDLKAELADALEEARLWEMRTTEERDQ